MRSQHRIWLLAVLPAALVAAAVGAHASSAASSRASIVASTIDKTYSCRVRSQHFVDLSTAVTLPPVDNQAQPGGLFVVTGARTIVKNGTTSTVTQVGLQARKNSFRVDTKSCHSVKKQIPLKPKGLATPAITVTPTLHGYDSEQCASKAHVLVRVRVTMKDNTPVHVLLAVRNDDAKSRPIAFYNWNAHKVTFNISYACGAPG